MAATADVRIAASVLAADFSALGTAVREADAAGVDWIHLDVMDGHFVPNLTFGPPIIQALRRHSDTFFDAHLMVERPDDLIPEYIRAGVNSITVHAEACTHLHRTLSWLRAQGVSAGVSLNPATPLSAIEEVLPDVDLILIMSVNPGFGGQRFIPQAMDKIRRCRQMLRDSGSHAHLSVDGGVSLANAAELVAAGADVLVSGSGLFGHPEGVRAGVQALRSALRD